MTTQSRKKLIEVALPLDAINKASAREKSIRHGHPSTLHLWWARRPLAAARAVLFAQLVDDPSAWPEQFPTEVEQERERQRLFDIIEELVPWENSNNPATLRKARIEIARSHARMAKAKAEVEGVVVDPAILMNEPSDAELAAYLEEMPPVHDPFAGGGTIPLEAQRLGLRAIGTDLNPVAVLINKALIELPPRFAGMPPVNPHDNPKAALKTWARAAGLAEDVRHYGRWMRQEAEKRLGHLYPQVELPGEEGSATVIAWLWARTVASPDPALGGAHVPLVSSFWLSKKKGRNTWVVPVVDPERRRYRFEVHQGAPPDPKSLSEGTKHGRGGFRCILSGAPIPFEYVREEGRAGRLGTRLMAVAAEGQRGRRYVAPSQDQEDVASAANPDWVPDQELPDEALGFRVQNYGLTRWSQLFTPRQLVTLNTLSELVDEATTRAKADAEAVAWSEDTQPLSEGGSGPLAYGQAIGTYLGIAVARYSNACSVLCAFNPGEKKEDIRFTFSRQALSMTWDYAEGNPFSQSSGNFGDNIETWVYKAIGALPAGLPAIAAQHDAAQAFGEAGVVPSTDPPYFDNIGYADLSDFFYIWLRRSLRPTFPKETSTMLVPKVKELIAAPYRHGGKAQAERFFLEGMQQALASLAARAAPEFPTTVYYAFKQSETRSDGTASTGWESFLEAALSAGYAITGTWPLSTERGGRTRDIKSNALATSVVLSCRKKVEAGPTVTRSDFRRALRAELPKALLALQHGNIAPVDVAQAAIGPGMAVFSGYERVLEADGEPMPIRSALALINETLDEHLTEQEGELDAETRFAVTWYEQHGWSPGKYGDAETLAKGRNVAVSGVVAAGIAKSGGGEVRLLARSEMPEGWDPATDTRLTIWEATQHLIKRLDDQGEEAAAALLRSLGTAAEHARNLAYRLFSTCERKSWADEARAYNALVVAWPELERLAASIAVASPTQATMFE